MNRTRLFFAAAIVALLAAVVGPAGAASGDKRDRAEMAAELDGLRASEQQLQEAIAALDAKVVAQNAKVEAAKQARDAAEAEVAEQEAELARAEKEIDAVLEVLVDRAVESFINPEAGDLTDMVEASSLGEATRREALIGQVAVSDNDVIDQLVAVRKDVEDAAEAARKAKVKAEERRRNAEAEAAQLKADQDNHNRLLQDNQTRERELEEEINQLAAGEAGVQGILQANASAAAPDGAVGAGGCIFPTRGPVTSGYGTRNGRLHAGIDIGAPTGTPIWAAKAGTVIFAGTQSGYGNTVIIDHGGGATTLYAHQSRIAVHGGSVSQGQVIGYVGSTGRSSGPHLHFETRYGNSPRDPRGCL